MVLTLIEIFLTISVINKCHPNPCRNYGSCTEVERDFECSCKQGYRGKRCERERIDNFIFRAFDIGFISRRPLISSYFHYFSLVENKCEPNPCLNGATCSESEDDYVCTCRAGFLGHSCEGSKNVLRTTFNLIFKWFNSFSGRIRGNDI